VQTWGRELRVWNSVRGEMETWVECREEDGNWGLVVSANGEVAWGNGTGKVIALDLATDRKRIVQQHRSPVTCLAALPDGRLASGHVDGVVCVGDTTFTDPNRAPIGAIAAVGDGRIAFSTSDGKVRVWSPGSDQLDTLPGLVSSLASLPDGRLVTAGVDGLVLWDQAVPSGRRVLSDAPAQCVLAAPGPRLIKVAEDDSLWAWNLQTGTDRLLQGHESGTAFVEPLACGRLRPWLPAEDEAALAYLLDHRVLSEEFAVQQALSALPELEGRWHGDSITLEADIPPDSPNISSRAWVVVVIDAPAT
jgi:WD40 repeat protein